MRQLFRDSEHLLRMAGLFVIGISSFFVVRALMVPRDFGLYGHFRAGALEDNMALSPVFAGQDACADCHVDEFAERDGAGHAEVRCESCHGPQASHAADPSTIPTAPPRPERLCAGCHEQSPAKPSWFPQVVGEDHSSGEPCDSCHEPHRPELE